MSVVMKGREITWGDKITAALKGRPGRRRPLADRFWEKVARRGPAACWEWTGAIDTMGYGVIAIPTEIGKTRKGYAHRVSLEMDGRPIPPGLEVLHSCDNRTCVNPAHLSIGTRLDNVTDMHVKGRGRKYRPTRCKNGHPFDEANTYVRLNGSRSCRACSREWMRAKRERHRN